MQTSRNPKVLNHTLKYKLQPVLDKIETLEGTKTSIDTFITECKATETTEKAAATTQFGEYTTAKTKLTDKISESNTNLDNLIAGSLYNPNVASTSSDTGGTTITETKYIYDKPLKGCSYNFIKDGVSYVFYGVIGKGLAIGKDPGYSLEYTWRNPGDASNYFPSYYINNIFEMTTSRALIASNNGIIDYDFSTNTYVKRDSSYGLPSDEVHNVIGIQTSDGSVKGYLASTSYGLAYSPTAERWTPIDSTFTESVNCLSRSEAIVSYQNIVYIGTSSGLYYIDVDELLLNDTKAVHALTSLTKCLPSSYVNGISYDTSLDKMCVVTTGGCTVFSNITELVKGTKIASENYALFTSKNGLTATSCYDVYFTAGHKCIICTSNGLTVTSNFINFLVLTTQKNTTSTNASKLLTSHVCNQIVRMASDTYTIIHSVGLTEGIVIN